MHSSTTRVIYSSHTRPYQQILPSEVFLARLDRFQFQQSPDAGGLPHSLDAHPTRRHSSTSSLEFRTGPKPSDWLSALNGMFESLASIAAGACLPFNPTLCYRYCQCWPITGNLRRFLNGNPFGEFLRCGNRIHLSGRVLSERMAPPFNSSPTRLALAHRISTFILVLS